MDDHPMPEPGAATQVADGIYRLPVPVPFSLGHVNAYLVEGSPLTLIDSGANLATAMVTLERMLVDIGHSVRDLELLVITHQHVDHFGLTGLLAERSGADVACLDLLADFVQDFSVQQAAGDAYAQRLMLRHGIDPHVVDALGAVAVLVAGVGAPARITRPLAGGDVIDLGHRGLRVLHRPGHSPSDTVFHDESSGVLISGDHVLSKVSSNALITRPLAGDPEARTRPLIDYRGSLAATQALDATLILGGHGPVITDAASLIEHRLARQIERAEYILDLLKARPMTGHEIASAIWGRIAFTQAFLTLSEVLGHLDLLLDDGSVAADETDAVVRFART